MKARVQTQTNAAPSYTPVSPGLLQRKSACGDTLGPGEECRKKQLNLQRGTANQARTTGLPPIVGEVLNTPGLPLEPETRAFMESRFGHDFGRVRVHTDARAAQSARAVDALACTIGRDVVFGAGQYAPHTSEGARLLAHELTHAVQQEGARGVPQAELPVSSPGDTGEREADRVADILDGDVASSSEAHANSPTGARAPHVARGVLPRLSSTGFRVARQQATGSSAPAFTVEERIRDELAVKVEAVDVEGIERRRRRLRDLFESVPASKAKALYGRLSRGTKGDEFAKFFVYRLSSDTRDEMLGILRNRFAAEPQAPAQSPPAEGPQSPTAPGGVAKLDEAALQREYDAVLSRLTAEASYPDRASDEAYAKTLEEEIGKRHRREQRAREKGQMSAMLTRLNSLGEAASREEAGGPEFKRSVDEFKQSLKDRMDALKPEELLPPDLNMIMKALMLWSTDPGNQWGEGIWDSRDLVMSASAYATVPASQYKCNAYVAEIIYQSLDLVFKVHASKEQPGKFFPYQAKEWGDPGTVIPSFPVVDKPEMGDVWSNGSHTGIFLGEYAGKKLYISARDRGDGVFGLRENVQREKGIQIKFLPDEGVYRRYTP